MVAAPRRSHGLRDLTNLVSLGLIACLGASCTAINYTLGPAVSRNPPPRRAPAAYIPELRPGAHVGVAVSDTVFRYGTFLGLTFLDDSAYATRYSTWAAAEGRGLALGTNVRIHRQDGGATTGAFAGFGFRGVLLRSGSEIDQVDLPMMIRLQVGPSTVWSRKELAQLAKRRQLPLREAMLLKPAASVPSGWFNRKDRVSRDPGSATGSLEVAVDDVRALEVQSQTARNAWIALGVTMDLLLIAMMGIVF